MIAPSREQLKRAVLARLDMIAVEHRLGHQDVRANRYSMRSEHDAPVELMFEKGKDDEPHLWVLAWQASAIPDETIPSQFYSKDDLYKTPAKNGGMQYGRHAALEKMTWLGKADLRRFTLRNIADLDLVLSHLSQARRVTSIGS